MSKLANKKYLNQPLLTKRARRWQELFTEYGVKTGVPKFVEEFDSYPTPAEYKLTKHYIDVKHVYFITDGEYVKIGIARDTRHRLSGLQTANARKLAIACVIPYGGMEMERELHQRFKDSRAKGEWFKITPELYAYIKKTAEVNYHVYGIPLSECITGIEHNEVQED